MKTIIKAAINTALPALARDTLLRVWRRAYWGYFGRPSRRRTNRAIKSILRSGRPIRLELGSGPRAGMEEWTSVDLHPGATIQHDLRTPLPLPDASVDEIYSSHMLEHLAHPYPMLGFLRECHRLLKSGGILRLAVPNARLFLEAYSDPRRFDRERFCTEEVGLDYACRIDIVNFIAYLGGDHRFMFDEENLPYVLAQAGFRDARTRAFDAAIDVPRRRHESVYAVALK